MTIRTRFLLHYALVLVVLVTIGLYTEAQLDGISRRRHALREEWVELDRALALEARAADAVRAVDSGRGDEADRLIADLRAEIDALVGYQRRQSSELAAEFEAPEMTIIRRVGAAVDRLAALRGQPDSPALREVQREIEEAVSDFHRVAKAEMTEAIDAIHRTEGSLDRLMYIWLAALVSLLALGAHIVHRHVTRPLRTLQAGAVAVRARDFGHRIPEVQRDEIGEVARAFNEMTDELQTLYRSLEDKVAEQADEIRRSVTELERTMRLATIGTLAAGVAHEINNPLEAISVRTEGMRRRAESDDLRQGLDLIAGEVRRCREITSRLLAFARQRRSARGEPAGERVDLGALVRETAGLLHLRTGARPDLRLELPPSGPFVAGDSTALRQVILNLLLNAADATEQGGEICVRASNSGGEVQLEVRDTGGGIDPADLPHLFDPFYTTKQGHGTGLGLSVSHGIVLDHGGTITIQSEGVGRGAAVLVTLPAARSAGGGR